MEDNKYEPAFYVGEQVTTETRNQRALLLLESVEKLEAYRLEYPRKRTWDFFSAGYNLREEFRDHVAVINRESGVSGGDRIEVINTDSIDALIQLANQLPKMEGEVR